MGVVLYGSQYWEDYELWVCIEGLKEDKSIKFGESFGWNRIEGKLLARSF